MPVCRECGVAIPVRAVIDGKVRNLQNRKYCLECSPFGKHNTRALAPTATPKSPDSPCPKCGKPMGKSKGSFCRSCAVTEWRRRTKRKAIAYKGGECVICGFDTHVSAMEFHHVDPSEKEFSFSRQSISWARVQKELDKCVLLCSNCHRALHSGELALTQEH